MIAIKKYSSSDQNARIDRIKSPLFRSHVTYSNQVTYPDSLSITADAVGILFVSI